MVNSAKLGSSRLGEFRLGGSIQTVDAGVLTAGSIQFSDSFVKSADGSIVLTDGSVLESDPFTAGSAGSVVLGLGDTFSQSVARIIDGSFVGVNSSVFTDEFSLSRSGGVVLSSADGIEADSSNTSVAGTVVDVSANVFTDQVSRVIDGGIHAAFYSPLNLSTQNITRDGSIATAQSNQLEPTYPSITANPGPVLATSGGTPSNIGRNQLGFFKLGLEGTGQFTAVGITRSVVDEEPLLADRDVLGEGVSRIFTNQAFVLAESIQQFTEALERFVSGDTVLTSAISQFDEGIRRGVGGDVVLVDSIEFVGSRILNEWTYQDLQLGTTIEEVREWDSLSLTVRYQGQNAQQAVSEIVNRSEKVEIREFIDGGFRAVDTSGVQDTLEFNAPTDREDVRPVTQWLVADYSRDLVDRDGDVYDLELELIPEKEKSFDNEYGTFESEPTSTAQSDEWKFTFSYGSFATRRVSVSTSQNPDGSTNLDELDLVLTPKEVRIVEENVSHLNLSTVREVPDGLDVVDDASSDERNTVSVETPFSADEPVPEGEYVFTVWETEWVGGAFRMTWEVVSDGN